MLVMAEPAKKPRKERYLKKIRCFTAMIIVL
jgi:hypothetical protein